MRCPTLVEGQTALARNFLTVLKLLYGKSLLVINTARYSSRYLTYLYELITAFNADCEVIHALNIVKSLVSVVGLLTPKRLITYQFSYLPEVYTNWRIKRAVIERGSRLVIATSRRIAELFSNGFFTYPPVDTELFRPRDREAARRALKLPMDKVIIGYIGDVDVDKGFDVVAELAAKLGGRDVKFLIAYNRIDNLSKDAVENLKTALRKNALIVRKLLPVWYMYNAVTALLLPIRGPYPTEPPMVLVEALASGTPVVGGPSPTMRDYEGFYLKVEGNYSEYVDVLKQLVTDKDSLRELSVRSREFAERNLSPQAVLQGISKISSAWM